MKKMRNIPASRKNIKEKYPSKSKPNTKVAIPKSKTPTVFGGKSKPSRISKPISTIGTQPTRAMFGLK